MGSPWKRGLRRGCGGRSERSVSGSQRTCGGGARGADVLQYLVVLRLLGSQRDETERIDCGHLYAHDRGG